MKTLKQLFNITSHELLPKQIVEINEFLEIEKIVNLPTSLKRIWENISPYSLLPLEEINKILNWLTETSNELDYVLIQGDFGATYYIVDFCFKNNKIPIYATSRRKAIEQNRTNGMVEFKRTFEHVNFRVYEQYH